MQPDDRLDEMQARLFELRRQGAIEAARSSFANFVLWVRPKYQMKWYHRLICEALDDMALGKCKRLIINVPPRHGKSELVSRCFPAYMLGIQPDCRFIGTSYNAELASMLNRDVQRVIDSDVYRELFPGTQLAKANSRSVAGKALRNADVFEIVGQLGSYRSAGVGGAITGTGGDCLAEGSPVSTPQGAVAIETLRPGDLVWSFNHATRQVEARPVQAVRALRSSRLVQVQFSSGRQIVCTDDHRFYVYGRGYVAAQLLRVGETVARIGVQERDLCGLQRRDAELFPTLPRLLRQGAWGGVRLALFDVRSEFRCAAIRVRKKAAQGQPCLLQPGLFAGASCHQESAQVPGLRQAYAQKDPEVLRVRLQAEGSAGHQALRGVRRIVQDRGGVQQKNLFKEMWWEATLAQDSGGAQRPLRARRRVPSGLLCCASFDRRAGQGLPSVRDAERAYCGSSYRPQQAEQYPRKLGFDVQGVSHHTPQITNDTVSAVVSLCGEEYRVYDIQVEGNNNFFARAILVHNCILIDDPVKNEEEARSPTYRQKCWEWYTNTLLTRQEHDAAICLCMTRWHEDDLAGRIQQRALDDPKADQWRVITLPAICEDTANPDDPRQIGEALWPEVYDLDYLETMRASMGEAGFAGLYQQRPSLQGAGVFAEDRWCYWYADVEPPKVMARDRDGNLHECRQERRPPQFDAHWQSWDMAFKDTKTSDYVVGQVQAKLGARTYVLDQLRGRYDFPRSLEAVRTLTALHPEARRKLIEDKANGPAIMAVLGREIPGLIAVNPDGGKEARANAIAPMQEAQNIYLPHPSEAPWVRAFVQECSQFPKGKFDDQVDALTQGLNWGYNTKRKRGKVRMLENLW